MTNNSLKEVIGLSIIKCFRDFSEEALEDIPSEVRDRESDGNTFLIFSNRKTIRFSPNSEDFTVDLKTNAEIPQMAKDVSNNTFWRSLIGKGISSIDFLFSDLPNPYGIRFMLENSVKIDIQYISESDYTFDALVIRN